MSGANHRSRGNSFPNTVSSESSPSVRHRESKQQCQARPSDRVMGERLPDPEAPAVSGYSNEPVPSPLKVGYLGVLELGVTVGTQYQQVSRVVAQVRVKVVHFKVGFAVPLLKRK